MAKPILTRSTTLYLLIGAFGDLFTILVTRFRPILAFALVLAATGVLAKL